MDARSRQALFAFGGYALAALIQAAALGADAAEWITPEQGAWLASISIAGIVVVTVLLVWAGAWPLVSGRPRLMLRLGAAAGGIFALAAVWYFWDVWPSIFGVARGFIVSNIWLAWLVAGASIMLLLQRPAARKRQQRLRQTEQRVQQLETLAKSEADARLAAEKGRAEAEKELHALKAKAKEGSDRKAAERREAVAQRAGRARLESTHPQKKWIYKPDGEPLEIWTADEQGWLDVGATLEPPASPQRRISGAPEPLTLRMLADKTGAPDSVSSVAYRKGTEPTFRTAQAVELGRVFLREGLAVQPVAPEAREIIRFTENEVRGKPTGNKPSQLSHGGRERLKAFCEDFRRAAGRAGFEVRRAHKETLKRLEELADGGHHKNEHRVLRMVADDLEHWLRETSGPS